MKNSVNPQKWFSLVLLRKDQDHIHILETQNEKEVLVVWKELVNAWKTCVKEVIPFTLDKPLVTAFDPGLISEIKILTKEMGLSDNPYKKEMLDKGFGNTLNNYTRTSDILDSGYKR
jgi:hypothetical protein